MEPSKIMQASEVFRALMRCLALAALVAATAPTAMRSTTLASDLVTTSSPQDSAPVSPTYYGEVRPILQKHCVVCHVTGGIAPMSFDTYQSTHRYALLIRTVTQEKAMPPAFAIPLAGQVTNNPELTAAELAILADWANAKAPEGSPDDATFSDTSSSPPWSIPKPDLILPMAHTVDIPPDGLP
ncbi:MAG TPA: cytochrome c, partial [Candidatus Eremiobacteraceae bacterium]|nr:cytochrome c [Candidatus Eremiobacteraceae bacterium]